MPVIKARIRLSLDIVANSVKPGSTKKPYSQRKPAEQHVVKMNLLKSLTDPTLREWLDVWDKLTIKVDKDYQDSVPSVPALIQGQFDLAKDDLDGALGFSLQSGTLCNGQPCTKQSDCSHDCKHLYQTIQVPVDGSAATTWIVEDDDVVAYVITSLEWTTASSAKHDDIAAATTGPVHVHGGGAAGALTAAAAAGAGTTGRVPGGT